jgi:hypothetical protein
MSVGSMVSGSGILELERQALSSFQGATKSMATALEVLWAIKEGDIWKEHLVLNTDGGTEQAFTNFATGYLPYFLETYGPQMGVDYSAGWILAKFRMYKELQEAGASDSFEDVLKIKNQYTIEQFVRQLESQGESGKQAASELLKQAVEGTVDLNSLRQEAGLYAIRYVVEQGTRRIWVRLPDEGDFFVGDFGHLPNRAWLSFEQKLKPITIETGEGY